MANDITLPLTGSGDSTKVAATYEDSGNRHVQRMVLADASHSWTDFAVEHIGR
jgi:hypothetical protein